MKTAWLSLLLFAFWTMGSVAGASALASERANPATTFQFGNAKYLHRYTKDDQREYTPEGQEDLKVWTEMVTINIYRGARDGEALAATASRVVEVYKANRGHIVRTDSVPRANDRPAEHLIVAVLGKPEFLEAVFARFILHNGMGAAIIYSHRIYGQKVGPQMSAWLQQAGQSRERILMQWDPRLISDR